MKFYQRSPHINILMIRIPYQGLINQKLEGGQGQKEKNFELNEFKLTWSSYIHELYANQTCWIRWYNLFARLKCNFSVKCNLNDQIDVLRYLKTISHRQWFNFRVRLHFDHFASLELCLAWIASVFGSFCLHLYFQSIKNFKFHAKVALHQYFYLDSGLT